MINSFFNPFLFNNFINDIQTQTFENKNKIEWIKNENEYKTNIKTLGIEKVKIEIINDLSIKITGENKIDEKEYKIETVIPLEKNIFDKLIEIKYSTKAGITTIRLILDKSTKKDIKFIEE